MILPKKNQELPALNRYFGVFEDNTIKSRGMEARRHDTPPLFIKFQNELLQTIARANSIKEIIRMRPILKNIYNKYQYAIFSRKVSYMDLIFTKRITKDSVNYSNRKTIESCVIQLLINDGNLKHAGEEIKYIITDFYSKTHLDRAMPIELIEESHINYDIKRYCKLLDNTYNSIIKYFK